jgi:glutamate-ammonia-ligase adenylyltransferase
LSDSAIIESEIGSLPGDLGSGIAEAWERLAQAQPRLTASLAADADFVRSLVRVWACSEFVMGACLRNPQDLEFLAGAEGVGTPWREGGLAASLQDLADESMDEAACQRILRQFRRRQFMRAAWRDLAGHAALEETLGHVSEVADLCLEAAVRVATRAVAAAHGEPLTPEGDPSGLLVLAMGKLGGRELNFSSDIDLVFLFASGGETTGRRPLSHEQFFNRVGQRVIRLLDQVTEDGLVFRVDMRLRPFGDSGPLVVSIPALEDYLQQHGRAWERYAYVKARPITGYRPGMGLYGGLLRPFVYRRYLDYGVFESLRELKRRIESETGEAAVRSDVKRGPGGIREIEFIVQSYQILRGGADRNLRESNLLTVLPALARAGHLTDAVASELEAAYRFLRRTENHLQQWQDRQVHRLPDSETGRTRLAFSMGFADWQAFSAELGQHRERVEQHFRDTVIGEAEAVEDGGGDALDKLWSGVLEPERAEQELSALGYTDPDRAFGAIVRLAEAGFVRRLDAVGRRRLDALMPAIIRRAAARGESEQVLERLLGVLDAIGLRSAYFALLNENPGALDHLAELCAQSEFLVRQVERHPLLLDELIDPRVFDSLPDRPRLLADLRQRLSSFSEDEFEGQLEVLRQFQRSAVFLVAVADLSGRLPVMKVSDRLTDIAEAVLEVATGIALRQTQARYGVPRCGRGADRRDCGFAIIGYGKLGGLELGYGSDLDLVFVHDSAGDEQVTEGAESLDNGLFFGRLTRRLVHVLTTQTASGSLYEVDTRLRPSGKGGLLVTSLTAFERYQRTEAWTWEHQALLRARAVAGDADVRQGFEEIRRRILSDSIRRDTLREDVARMRTRMLAEHASKQADRFDIKADRGGIGDIEFLVQYWVLSRSHEFPALLEYSDNVRQLEALVATGVLEPDLAETLRATYLSYRTRLHQLFLDGQPGLVPADEFADQQAFVSDLWHAAMES